MLDGGGGERRRAGSSLPRPPNYSLSWMSRGRQGAQTESLRKGTRTALRPLYLGSGRSREGASGYDWRPWAKSTACRHAKGKATGTTPKPLQVPPEVGAHGKALGMSGDPKDRVGVGPSPREECQV